MTAYSCRECGGDVVRVIVGGLIVYRHAVSGIDHAPAPNSWSALDAATPMRPHGDVHPSSRRGRPTTSEPASVPGGPTA